MRLLALLFVAFFGSLASSHEAEFNAFTLRDIEINERLLAQAKLDAQSGSQFHKFPQAAPKRTKRDTNCPAGYTGVYCESPICTEKVDIPNADITETYIQKQLSVSCNDPVTIYIDSHLYFVKIAVQTSNRAARPKGSLYTSNGTKIDATTESTQGNAHVYRFVELVKNYGAGTYKFIPQSGTDDDCTITASSATPLVVFGGFVESQFSDKVQQITADGKTVQRNPTQLVPSYFGFTATNTTTNDAPKWVSFHRGNDTYQQFAPLPVLPRYNCNADQYAGPYVCLDTGDYILKVRGTDDAGGVWQRVYVFSCDPNENIPGPPTASPEPVLECENGGTLIKQSDQNVCYCGAHFTGATCKDKVCDHGASVNLQGDCECPEGYSGRYCEHITCTDRLDTFKTDTRGITFVVRANQIANDQIFKQVRRAISLIFDYFDDSNPGAFEEYGLVLFINGGTIALRTFRSQLGLITELDATQNLWAASTNDCEDKVFQALYEALGLTPTTKYLKGPVFVFTDAVSNDDLSTIADLGLRLGAYKSPVYTIFYGGGTDACNQNTDTSDYRYFRRLAQYTHGLSVKVSPDNDEISDTAFSLAIGFFNNNLLTSHDLLDSCQYAPGRHIFFVDDSVGSVVIAVTGSHSIKLRVIDTAGNKIEADNRTTTGDLQLAHYVTLDKGHYQLTVDANGANGPCSYRIYAQSRYEAFFAATTEVNKDRTHYQPIAGYDLHMVGLVRNVDYPDPENMFAEVVIWQENDNTIGSDRREVLYASSGVYRDNCAYNLYFGQWKCPERDRIFYVNLYVTDASGFTVLRTTTAQCATNSGPPKSGCRNGGVSYKGKCLCTAGWTGKNCQTADCYNGGTSDGDHCHCSSGFGGEHCQLFACPNQNTRVNFGQTNVTFNLIVQKSKDLVSALLKMQKVVGQVVNNLKSTHKDWIGYYTYWEFDDQNVRYVTKTPFADSLVTEVQDMIDSRRPTAMICKELKVQDVLIEALSDPDATLGTIVYLYVYGGMVYDIGKQGQLFKLIDQLEAKIHIVQDGASIRCFNQDFEDKHLKLIAGIAHYSGGTFSLSGDGATLLGFPLHENRKDCKGTQTFYFPVESETQTIALGLSGEIRGDPTFTPPNGNNNNPIVVYKNILDRMYIALRECPEGWNKSGDHCFRMEPATGATKMKSWKDAKDACKKLNAVLATVNSADLNTFLTTSVGPFSGWIGLNDLKRKGTFAWDQGDSDPIPFVDGTSYANWKSGEPKVDNGRCVAFSAAGWYVTNCDTKLSYICSRHAYDISYDPADSKEGHLARGLWSVSFDLYPSSDPQPCGLRIDVQSGLQVWRNNYQLAHIESTANSGSDRSTLEYAHFYPSSSPDLAFVTRMTSREHCTYEYISDAFNPQLYGYMVGFTGFDPFGYPFQRILPTVAFDNTVTCQHGGVQAPNENRCVCPPAYGGKECGEPVCLGGILAPNDIKCKCFDGYVGDNCELPDCNRGSGFDPPPITSTDKTFALIIDGSWTGYNGLFLSKLATYIDQALGGLKSVETQWFRNFIGIVAFDKKHIAGTTSKVFSRRSHADLSSDLVSALTEQYNAPTSERNFMNALMKIMSSPDLAVGSPIYIVTDSAIADVGKFDNSLYNLIAQKHVTINVIILGDTQVPGKKSAYRDRTVRPYFDLTVNTGGGFYQVKDADSLAGYWTAQLASYFRSISLAQSYYPKCTDRTDYFQIGGEDTSVIIDIFSPVSQSIAVYGPDDKPINPTGLHSTNTNYLWSISATKPGIYYAKINHNEKTDACLISVRAVRKNAPAVGFNTDTGRDRGLNSQGSAYAPTADINNAIIAHSDTDLLRYAHIYTHDTGNLVFTTPLIPRTPECKWKYSSKNVFQCPATSFTVAIEGTDLNGHQFRRLYKTHCIDYDSAKAQGAKLGAQNVTLTQQHAF
ncbi:hypothetical protein M3Y97_00151900 [Aphelenchoides bicaudatus]|nr:hypothetical protein M3Y97_00151900 [Aphelenchoides bicaudatus]